MSRKIYLTKNQYLLIVFIFFILINLARFNFEPFNLEWYFTEYAKYFHDDNYYFTKDIYRENQANTSFYSFLISIALWFNLTDSNLMLVLRIFNIVFLFSPSETSI